MREGIGGVPIRGKARYKDPKLPSVELARSKGIDLTAAKPKAIAA